MGDHVFVGPHATLLGCLVGRCAYLATAATSLLVLGRLSDHLGRRTVAVAALLSCSAGTAVLMTVHSLAPLLLGRVLQGIAVGLASSAIGAYVVDSAPRTPRWLAAAITTGAPMVGIPLGALLCGALVDDGPAPTVLTYTIVACCSWSPRF